MIQTLVAVFAALILDRLLPERFGLKPFDWYRDWAESLEQRFNGGARSQGVGAALLAIVPVLALVLLARYFLGSLAWPLALLFDVFVLYFCLDVHRVSQHAAAVAAALEAGDLEQAKGELREMTGKAAGEVTPVGITRATIEGVFELGSSVLISPVFWFILIGPAGAVLQRLAAVLDSLWGHRTERFANFGWAAARLDDLIAWLPARITAVSYALMGNFEDALHCWRRQKRMWTDINSGPVLASGFGAMHLQDCEEVAPLEDADAPAEEPMMVLPDINDVERVVALVWRVMIFWSSIGVLTVTAHFLAR